MRVNIINEEFSDLTTAILSDGSQIYKASTSWLPSGDFIQTGFDWFPDKIKFTDSLKISDLDLESSELIGNELPDLERTELTLFPTLSSESGNNNKFFGSFLDQSLETFGFSFGSGIEWAKIYEDSGDEEYSIMIQFEDFEIDSEKLVFIIVSSIESQSVKISYNLWLSDNNGNYKMKDLVLRNDDFREKVPLTIDDEMTNFSFSSISGSLVGTKNITDHPIFDNRNKLKKEKNIWCPTRVYGLGEKVKLGKDQKVYESILSRNLGNHPCTSGAWIESGFIERCLNRTAQVVVDYKTNPGTISPYGIINYPYNITDPSVLFSRTFDYTENTGYQLKGVSIDGEHLVGPEGYYINTTSNKIVVNKPVFTSIINSGYLYFLFSKIIGKIKLFAIETGEDTSYIEIENLLERSDWKNIITDPYTLVQDIRYTTGEPISIEEAFDTETETGIELGKSIELKEKYVGEEELKLSRILVKYSEDKTQKVREITDYHTEEDSIIKLIDSFEYTTETDGSEVLYPQYYFYYDPMTYKILVYPGYGIEVSVDSVTVNSGSSFDLYFYTTVSGEPVIEIDEGSYQISEISSGNYKISLENIRSNIGVTIYVNQ